MEKFYFIRHKETHEWLPCSTQRNSTSASLGKTRPPRLFVSRVAAKLALNWWAEGVSYNLYRNDDSLQECVHIHGRNKDDMEIVEVTLIVT